MTNEVLNNDIRIWARINLYDDNGECIDQFYDEVQVEDLPEEMIESLVSGETIYVEIAPYANAIYFAETYR